MTSMIIEYDLRSPGRNYDDLYKTELNVLEYLMYQTGNIIRLLITLKQAEPAPEN